MELFYKDIENPLRRYENLFDPYRFVPELQPDRIPIVATGAFSRGLEFTYSGAGGDLQWSLNYTFGQVKDRDSSRWIERRWDQTHAVNAVTSWQPGNWDIGIAAAWHTGWTMTRVPLEITPPFLISQYRSNDRLRNFVTLDAKVTYTFDFPGSSLAVFLELTNLVNRSNKGGVDYEISQEDTVYLLEETDLEPVFPLTPNLGFIWRF